MAGLSYVTFPVSGFADNGVRYGFALPFGTNIREGFDLGKQFQVDLAKSADNNYHTQYLYSFTFGKALTGNLSGFIEGVVTHNPFAGQTNAFANGGFIYSIFLLMQV